MLRLVAEALIDVDKLSKTFRIGLSRKRVDAVREVSFDVRAGDIFGFLGPNGAGKTTTIKMLTGADRTQWWKREVVWTRDSVAPGDGAHRVPPREPLRLPVSDSDGICRDVRATLGRQWQGSS